ncbi:MAG: diversity-generating retroelement protein Avd [Bacteroides sp.]
MAEEQEIQNREREREDFILLEKIADMTKYGKRAVAQFPRRERQTADKIRECMLTMLRLAVRVKKKYYKKTTLQELDEELAVLRFMIRIAQDTDYYDTNITPPLPKKKFEVWAKMNNEIGRIIGGYIKSQK